MKEKVLQLVAEGCRNHKILLSAKMIVVRPNILRNDNWESGQDC